MENLEIFKIVEENCKAKGTAKCTANCRDCAAIALYKAGYRKQSEVRSETAREFAEKAVEAMNEHAIQHGYDAEGSPYYTVDIAVLQIEMEQIAEEYGKEE